MKYKDIPHGCLLVDKEGSVWVSFRENGTLKHIKLCDDGGRRKDSCIIHSLERDADFHETLKIIDISTLMQGVFKK